MTTIAIISEAATDQEAEYRAVAGRKQSLGNTPGEALDAITAQLGEQESGTLLVVQQMRPDRFFSAKQRQRLAELMAKWRSGRDLGMPLPAEELAELEQLTAAELEASTKRATALLSEIQP